jgi:hypothetical protein
MNIIAELISIANSLDENQKYSEANEITNIAAHIRKAQDNFGMDDREHISDCGDLEDTDDNEVTELNTLEVFPDSYHLTEMENIGIKARSIDDEEGNMSSLIFNINEQVEKNKFKSFIVSGIYYDGSKDKYIVEISEKKGGYVADPLKGLNSLWGSPEVLKDKIHYLIFNSDEVVLG